MKRDLDVAVIMKKIVDGDEVSFVPLDVLEGNYDTTELCFVDLNGTPYTHIIEDPDSVGFCNRLNFNEIKKHYPLLTKSIIKKLILHNAKKFTFEYIDAEFTGIDAPIIMFFYKDEEPSVLLDDDVVDFYKDCYPEVYNKIQISMVNVVKEQVGVQELEENKLEEIENELPKQVNYDMDISKMFNEITTYVIDQEEPIKKILTAIWKQYNDFSEGKSRNILINGSTGVGKTETFRRLAKIIDVPIVVTAATEYSATGYIGKSVDDMLISLVKAADGDVKKAERGILVIDEIDKISESGNRNSQVNQRDVQESILKVLEDGKFNIKVGFKDVEFDTSKLMVVGMGSWSRIDLTPDKVVGFEQKAAKKTYKDITREDIVANGLIPELVGRFPNIVQMNELNTESFERILKSKNNTLTLNKAFFLRKGVELKVDDAVIKFIAQKANKNNYGARGLDEIVERALSIASFEIAINPDKYSELIITEETIEDNNKYKLVKKMEQDN